MIACAAALFAGGFAKGVTGIGLPLVAMPVLANFISVPHALALLVVPSVITSACQAFLGGYFLSAIKRVWILVIGIAIGVSVGVTALVAIELKMLEMILGILVVIFSFTVVCRAEFKSLSRMEKPIALAAGFMSGIIGGLSMFFGPIYAMFLAGLGLSKDYLVAAIAVTTVCSSLFLALALILNGVLGVNEFAMSLLAAVPVAFGLWIGHFIRGKINEKLFRRTLAVVLFLIGVNLVRKALTNP